MQKNMALVRKFLTAAFKDKDVNTAADLITERYIQHNPNVPTGKTGFIEGVSGFYAMYPDLQWELKRIWCDGDYVIVHSHYRYTRVGKGNAVVEIFKIADGKITEHWDVSQEIPEIMAHSNGMF
jgi:predicted SnoaL-like aldol condensation-catalyzing enzyme